MVPSIKFPQTMLTVNDVTHTMTLVCIRGLKKILKFGNWEIRLREREAETMTCGGREIALKHLAFTK